MIGGEDDKGQLATCKILLIGHILIAGEQQIEPCLFGCIKQGAVLQSLPSQLIRAHYLMAPQESGEWGGSVGVEKGSSRNRRGPIERALGKSKNIMRLLSTDGREPLQKFVYGRALVEVFKQRGNRHAGTSEAPRPAKLPGVPVDGTAKAPVHTVSLSLMGQPVRNHLALWNRIRSSHV